jgi:cytochrome c oxidase subunit 3
LNIGPDNDKQPDQIAGEEGNGSVVNESHAGDHTPVVQLHLRYGMILFIASEVMFFVAWFWAYFDASLF